jgi:RHS repeat-associated protein
MVIPGRSYASGGYRFGFQGQETDDEVYGPENAVSYKYRVHDARLGRFLSVDPMAHLREWVSPYNFVQNNPIMRTDPTGALDGEYDVTHDENGNEVKTKTSTLGDAEGIDFNHHLDGAQKGNTEIVNNNTGTTNWINGGVGLMRRYTQRGNGTDWNSIFSEWRSETGPQNSLMFGRDNTMIKEIRTSNLYHGARNDYLKKQAFDFDGKISKGSELISFANYLPALKAAVLSGNNMTMQMMGTVNVSFYNIGNHQRLVFINDSKSVESFNRLGSFMGYQFSDFLDRVPSRVTRQTYMWIDNNVEE